MSRVPTDRRAKRHLRSCRAERSAVETPHSPATPTRACAPRRIIYQAASLFVLAASTLSATSCGSARKARQARRAEAARIADSIADSTAAARRAQELPAARTNTARNTPSADTVETAALDPSKSSVPAYLLSLHGRATPFQTFSAKARMEYESAGKSQDFTATFRIRRDSAIWISAVAVGGLVPVARILITPDTFRMVNYLTREASVMRIEDAAAILPLPARFSQLQALLLGDVLEPSADIVSTGRAESRPLYYIATRTPAAAHTAFYNAADTTLASEEMVTADRRVSTTVLYTAYTSGAAKKFAAEREVRVDVEELAGAVQHTLRMRFTDAPRFDAPLEFSFSIPKNYTLK